MKRDALSFLESWKRAENPKPLVLRGARQVGKSWLVREFGNTSFENVIELNFESDSWAIDVFDNKDVRAIIEFLELKFNQRIEPGKTLLFLDEIQSAPKALTTLRYFYERVPGLHVVAAGALLDFALKEHQFSMPVGRIEYLHLGPMTFEEFLDATGASQRRNWLESYTIDKPMNPELHKLFMDDFRRYCLVGGMPDCVKTYIRTQSFIEVQRVQESILATFQDDFSKYSGRYDVTLLRRLFAKTSQWVGKQVKYAHFNPDARSQKTAAILKLFEQARLIYRVVHSHGNGIPLGAQLNEKDFKLLFLDVGLLANACRLDMTSLLQADDIVLVNSGAVCEQFIGQTLFHLNPFWRQPELYYWTRQKSGTTSEVDYLIEQGSRVVPIEVKSGATGRLKSLHVFVQDKQLNVAVRFNADLPSRLETQTAITSKEPHPFTLISLPLYMAGQIKRIIENGKWKMEN